MTKMACATVNRGLVLLSERDRLRKLLTNIGQMNNRDGGELPPAPETARARLRLSEVEEILRNMGMNL